MIIGPEELLLLDAAHRHDLRREYRNARATSDVLAVRIRRLAAAIRAGFTKNLAQYLIEPATPTTPGHT